MQRVVFVGALGVLVAFVACSSQGSDDESAPTSDPDAATLEDASKNDPSIDASTDVHDAAVVDAALPPGEGVSVESAKTALSCDAVCASKKYTCGSTTCPDLGGALGVAAYLGGNSTNLACADTPAPTNGDETFSRVDCCCVAPFVLFAGPTPSKSCADVCTAHSLKCDATHDWGTAGRGGLDAQYERPSTTAVTDYAYACTKVPTATIDLTKPTEKGQLAKYTCACVAP